MATLELHDIKSVAELVGDDHGQPCFDAVEGVAFLGTDQVVVATDVRDEDRHRETEQSVAVFDLP